MMEPLVVASTVLVVVVVFFYLSAALAYMRRSTEHPAAVLVWGAAATVHALSVVAYAIVVLADVVYARRPPDALWALAALPLVLGTEALCLGWQARASLRDARAVARVLAAEALAFLVLFFVLGVAHRVAALPDSVMLVFVLQLACTVLAAAHALVFVLDVAEPAPRAWDSRAV